VALVPDEEAAAGLPFATLVVQRGAANLDLPGVAVEPGFDDFATAATILVDGERAGFVLAGDGALKNSSDAVPLLRQLASASGAALLGKDGKAVARISGTGAAAALRWMDEQQLRTGSTAILAIGNGQGLQIAPELPRIVPPPASGTPPRKLSQGDVEAIRGRYGCGNVADSHVTQTFRLDARTSVAIVPCMLHAYQSSSIVLLLPNAGPWRPAPLERRFAPVADDPTPEWMTEPEFDPDTRSLWSSSKGRGIGDCGSNEAYVWDGRTFRLAYMATMDRCQGSRARITLWRTVNQPE
jgi:hypothetical protein